MSQAGSQGSLGSVGESPSPESSPSASSAPNGSGGPTASDSASPTPSPGDATPSSGVPSGASQSASTGLETVPVEPLTTKAPVELTETADIGTGLTLQVSDIKAVTGEARVQGEIAGPALWVEIRAENGTGQPVSLATAQVEITYGADAAPGIALSGPDVSPFPSSLAPGKAAKAAYVYGVPIDQRDQIQVIVYVSTDSPVVVFEGSAPR